MPDPVRLAKAELRELDSGFNEIPKGARVRVQFNPETLKVSFANQLKTPEGSQGGTAALQFVGTGTTKLSLQLWFDVTAPQVEEPNVTDVRKLTQKVAFYMLPGKKNPKAPPAVRFIWGTFVFDGVMESMDETLELFSPDGRPLRASVNVGLTQQRITFAFFERDRGTSAAPKEIAHATSGSTVQAIASRAGKADDWQDIAAANEIENPRQLPPGKVIDLNPRPKRR
jgi:contractile injection system tube protein